MIDTIFVPRGAEAAAVRRGIARVASHVRVVETGIGPHAASLAVRDALAGPTMSRVLVTGLCGSLTPAFAVGEALVYGEIVADGDRDGVARGETFTLDRTLAGEVAAAIGDVQSGVRAVAVDDVVVHASAKAELGARYGAQAVDMESLAVARGLRDAAVTVAVARVASDGVTDDLPDLHMALDGSGGLDGFALALAMTRRPLAGFHLARNGTRALAALQETIGAVLRS